MKARVAFLILLFRSLAGSSFFTAHLVRRRIKQTAENFAEDDSYDRHLRRRSTSSAVLTRSARPTALAAHPNSLPHVVLRLLSALATIRSRPSEHEKGLRRTPGSPIITASARPKQATSLTIRPGAGASWRS